MPQIKIESNLPIIFLTLMVIGITVFMIFEFRKVNHRVNQIATMLNSDKNIKATMKNSSQARGIKTYNKFWKLEEYIFDFSNVPFGLTMLQQKLILTYLRTNSSSISTLVNDSLISHTFVTKSQGDFSPQSPLW